MASIRSLLTKALAEVNHKVVSPIKTLLHQLNNKQRELAKLEDELTNLVAQRSNVVHQHEPFVVNTNTSVKNSIGRWDHASFPIYDRDKSFNFCQAVPVNHDGLVFLSNIKKRVKTTQDI